MLPFPVCSLDLDSDNDMKRSKLSVFGPVAALALAACAVPAAAPAQQAHDFVYIANQGEATVSVVDRTTREEVERIDLQARGCGHSWAAAPYFINSFSRALAASSG